MFHKLTFTFFYFYLFIKSVYESGLYTRLSAAEVRNQLVLQKGYNNSELPSRKTIANKLNALGYYPSKVLKSKPKKRFHKQTLFLIV